MFEDIPGRLLSGALWGLGAGLVIRIVGGGSGERRSGSGLRPLTKTLVKGYVVASDRVREIAAEARENLGDLYAEAQAEHQSSDGAAEPEAAATAAANPQNAPTGEESTGAAQTRRSRAHAKAGENAESAE